MLVPLHEECEAGKVHARLGDGLAILIVGEVVPDIAAIDLDGKVHLVAVVGRKLGRREGDAQQLRYPLGSERLHDPEHVGRGARPQARHERVGVFGDEIRHRVFDARGVLVSGWLGSARD